MFFLIALFLDGDLSFFLQNLLYVKDVDTPNRFGGVGYLGFEKLTFVPIQVCRHFPGTSRLLPLT